MCLNSNLSPFSPMHPSAPPVVTVDPLDERLGMTVSSAEGEMSVRLVFSLTPCLHHYPRLSQQLAD